MLSEAERFSYLGEFAGKVFGFWSRRSHQDSSPPLESLAEIWSLHWRESMMLPIGSDWCEREQVAGTRLRDLPAVRFTSDGPQMRALTCCTGRIELLISEQ